MADIPNTEYITVKANGIFVGGKPATTYRGKTICYSNDVRESFADIQILNETVAELHVLSSETRGEYAEPGNPSGKHGLNAWCRVKFENGNLGAWVFADTYSSAAVCARYCAYLCAFGVCRNSAFRAAVFGLANDKQNELTNALKDTDLSKFIGAHKIGAYEIVVRKSGQNTRG